ncbi:MAG: amino acid ABC transporter permease [Candidatus Lokiarchaeota archaeon]|nr:amino acid ABC transporter permease [Candidatus Harpocratesius repetitus]
MENSNEKIEIQGPLSTNRRRRALGFTNISFGWWILSIFVLLIIIGFIRKIFTPNANYFDVFIWIINLFLMPFGLSLGTIDYRAPIILRGLADGASLTFIISILSVVVGFFLAALLAIVLVNKNHLYGLKILAQMYVDFFRSTPLLVQILIVYFGFAQIFGNIIRNLNIPGFSYEVFAGTLALALNTAAYQAEIIRSGILAIPTGQTEAARGLGLTSSQTMRYVILPQAIRLIVPPLTNELINVLLNSSLVSAIGVVELTKMSQTLQAKYFLWQVYLIGALFYFVIAYTLSKITKKLEIKLRIPGLGVAND